jgi:RNA 3'-terminal phosphate cyclase (ATP)
MGISIAVRLERFGFYPAGGGCIRVEVEPGGPAKALVLEARGPATVRARALVAALPGKIGTRELRVVRERLGLDRTAVRVEHAEPSIGPGNALLIAIELEALTEIVTAFGEKGVSAETVAHRACDEAERFLRADVPVGPHLADQLLIPMALGAGGAFRTLAVSDHTRTNANVIRRFLDVPISITHESDAVDRVVVGDGTTVVGDGARTAS